MVLDFTQASDIKKHFLHNLRILRDKMYQLIYYWYHLKIILKFRLRLNSISFAKSSNFGNMNNQNHSWILRTCKNIVTNIRENKSKLKYIFKLMIIKCRFQPIRRALLVQRVKKPTLSKVTSMPFKIKSSSCRNSP